MSDTTRSMLADQLAAGGPLRDETRQALTGLAEISDWLTTMTPSAEDRENPTAKRLRDAERELAHDDFKLMVMGRFSSGKSTLLNALMAGVTHPVEVMAGAAGPLPVDELPSTAVLAGIRYSETPYVIARRSDGTEERWTLDRYLRESMLDGSQTKAENLQRFLEIEEFEIGYPSRLCQGNVMLYDSPGTDEAPERTDITRRAAAGCDAAIVVFSSNAPLGEREVDDALAAANEKVQLFVVVNMFDGKVADEKFKAYVWNKYIHERQAGDRYAGQDLAQHGLYLIDARAAEQGRARGDEAQVEASGILALERRLAEYLLTERLGQHVRRFAGQGLLLSHDVERRINRLRSGLETERGELREKYLQIRPRLLDLRRRGDRVARIIDDQKLRSAAALQAGLLENERSIRDGLAGHLETVSLKTAAGFARIFRTTKIQQEADEVINAFVDSRRREWSHTVAANRLARARETMVEDLTAEVRAIEAEVEDIQFQLTGETVGTGGRGELIGIGERITSTIIGIAFGNLTAGIGGGVGGYRSALGGVAATVGAAVVIVGMGLTAPVAIPLALIAGAVGAQAAGNIGLEKRIKKLAADHAVPHLTSQVEALQRNLHSDVERYFQPLAEQITAEVTAALEAEAQSIDEQAAMNERSQEEKEKALGDLSRAFDAVLTHRKQLDDTVAASHQI